MKEIMKKLLLIPFLITIASAQLEFPELEQQRKEDLARRSDENIRKHVGNIVEFAQGTWLERDSIIESTTLTDDQQVDQAREIFNQLYLVGKTNEHLFPRAVELMPEIANDISLLESFLVLYGTILEEELK